MNVLQKARYGIDSYKDWLEDEGLRVVEGLAIDCTQVETADWPRVGTRAAALHLDGRGDFCNMFLYELAPGQSTIPQRHLFEEVVYVVEGSGNTQIELPSGERWSFEWGASSLFAIPLNAKYRHFNGSGRERAVLTSTTNLPMMLNLFHNEQFVFDNEFDFDDRIGKREYFAGDGVLNLVRQGNDTWETNFIPDLERIGLQDFSDRGAGGGCLIFLLADSSMHAHVSEMPAGTYKKAHRHGPDFHVFAVTGHGFSLLWYEDEKDFVRIDWKHGWVFAPPDQMFHQHFNTAGDPARYLAIAFGSLRYPFTADKRRVFLGMDVSVKDGGCQIEYEHQDPRIHQIYLEELGKYGVTSGMAKFVDERPYAKSRT